MRQKYGVKDSDTRAGYLAQQLTVDLIYNNIRNKLRRAALCETEGKNDLAKELRTAAGDLETLLYMFGSKIMREEGVQVSPEGQIIVSKETTDKMNEPDCDEINGDIDGENITTDYDTSDNNTSAKSKMSDEFKRLVRDLSDGKDKYGYGLPTPIRANYALNQMLTLCRGCHSCSEMVDRTF